MVNDPLTDPRHNRELAASGGLRAAEHPLRAAGGQEGVLGAIELLNKLGRQQFDEGDLTLLTLIAGRISQAIELARAKEERIKQSHLASIGQMLSGVLHDLKTPMTIISGYAQLMAQSDETRCGSSTPTRSSSSSTSCRR